MSAGNGRLELPAMKAGGPYTLTVSGSSTVQFDDVMVGEVWLCSGQSNMEMGIGMVHDGKQEIAAANYPAIRLLMVTRKWTPQPQNDIEGSLEAMLARDRGRRRLERLFSRRVLLWAGTAQEARRGGRAD